MKCVDANLVLEHAGALAGYIGGSTFPLRTQMSCIRQRLPPAQREGVPNAASESPSRRPYMNRFQCKDGH